MNNEDMSHYISRKQQNKVMNYKVIDSAERQNYYNLDRKREPTK